MGRGASIVLVAAVSVLGLAGCANRGASGDTAAAQAAPAPQAAPAQQKAAPPPPPAAPKANAAPAGTKLSKVQVNPGQVLEIMGQPTDGARQYWDYKGAGRVVMGTNRWTGKQKMIAVEYDPSEDGY